MLVRSLILGCLWCGPLFGAEEPGIPHDLAKALDAIAERQVPTRNAGVFIPDWIKALPDFDVVDRTTDPAVWQHILVNDERLAPRLVAIEQLMQLAATEDRRLILSQLLFDSERFDRLSGCLSHRQTLGEWALSQAWPTLSDEQHWMTLRDWLTRAIPQSAWTQPALWMEFAPLLRHQLVVSNLAQRITSDAPARQQAALLLWLMTSYDPTFDATWQSLLPQALELLETLSRDPDPLVRRIAVRAWSDASGPSWGTADKDPRTAKRHHQLTLLCGDADPTVALDAALILAVPLSPYVGIDPSQTMIWVKALEKLRQSADVPQLARWLQRLIDHLTFREAQLPVEAKPLIGELALRLLQTEDFDLRHQGARLALRTDHRAALDAAITLAHRGDLSGNDLLGQLARCIRDFDQRVSLFALVDIEYPTVDSIDWLKHYARDRVPQLFAALDAEDPQIALQAYRAYCTWDEDWVFDSLVARLDDQPDQRAARQEALGNAGCSPGWKRALRRHLTPGDPLRTSAILVLVSQGEYNEADEGGDLLRSVLLDPRDPQRAAAAATLRKIWSDPPESKKAPLPDFGFTSPATAIHRAPLRALLERHLRDPDLDLRLEYLREVSLHPVRDEAATILTLLDEPEPRVRSAACRALSYIPDHGPSEPSEGFLLDGGTPIVVPDSAPQPGYAVAAERLHAGLHSPDPLVARTCAEILFSRSGDDRDAGLRHLLATKQYDLVTPSSLLESDQKAVRELVTPADIAGSVALRRMLWRMSQAWEHFPDADVIALRDASRILRNLVWPSVQGRIKDGEPSEAGSSPRQPLPAGYEAAVRAAHAEAVQRDLEIGLKILGLDRH
jgi:HEAT repeat protein